MKKISSLNHNKSIAHNTLQEALNNVSFLMKKIHHIEQLIDSPEENNLSNLQDALETDLKWITSISKDFNNLFEKRMNNFEYTSFIYDNNWFQYPQYPIPNLSSFVPGTRIKGIISQNINLSNGVFYMIDAKKNALLSNIYSLLGNKNDLKPITDSNKLKSGDLIAVSVNGKIVRAIIQITPSGFCLFLIDIGEEIRFNKVAFDEKLEMYYMPYYYKTLPAQALMCKVEDLTEKVKLLLKNLHGKIEVEVLQVKFSTIHVKFDELSNDPPLNDSFGKPKSTIDTFFSKYSITNPFYADMYTNSKAYEVVKKKQCNKNDAINEFLKKCLTETSNAMVAVLEYDSRDKAKYGEYYDEKSGVNCNLIPQKQLKDDCKREQVSAFTNIIDRIPVPRIGDKIKIKMCYCEDIHSFYGWILNSEFHRRGAISLTELNDEINNPDYMKKYKRFTKILPSKGELVIAPYCDSYYRARITDVDDETAVVFFVDYGNYLKVRIKELYGWESIFGRIPFQAVLFKISGVIPNEAEEPSSRANELDYQLVGRVLNGVVLQNTSHILVRLFLESNGQEVLDLLLASGLAVLYD